jgi:guanine deaminase
MSLTASSVQRLRTVRGLILAPHATDRRLSLRRDAVLRIDDQGTIVSVDEAAAHPDVPVTWPGTVILPGFVDTHIHFPQTCILGSASGPLLAWLAASVFPEEARFADRRYAEAVAAQFCEAMLAQGTTCASIYSSSHPDATDALFVELDRRGLRAQAGLTLMNRGAPDAVLLDTGQALEAAEALIERWHGHDRGRLRFCVTPRFALSCDPSLLRGAADLAERHGLLVQTHLSEHVEELRQTADAFPNAADYLAVYEDHGLVGERSIFAHCVHLSDDEWRRLAAQDAGVCHCPDSNFFLGSGTMPLARALDRGIRVGLGSDIGAGRTFSLQRVAARGYDASLVRNEPLSPESLLWLATRGGAIILGFGDHVGCIAPGYDADLVAVDVPEGVTDERLFDALLFRHDVQAVRATVIRGAVRWSRAGAPDSQLSPSPPVALAAGWCRKSGT